MDIPDSNPAARHVDFLFLGASNSLFDDGQILLFFFFQEKLKKKKTPAANIFRSCETPLDLFFIRPLSFDDSSVIPNFCVLQIVAGI